MRYPATITHDTDGWSVIFPDIPEAITCGTTFEEARKNAADALESALDFYFDDRRAVPLPSKAKRHQQLVELPASVAAKVLLLNELVAQGIRPADLARRLKLPKSEMTRILDPHHATKIDTIAAAMAALGKRLELSVAAAA
jgi:antitoxin HicB